MPVLTGSVLAAAATGAATQTAVNVDHWWDVTKWDSTTWMTAGLGALVTVLIVVWGAVRFWLVVTRPPKIKEVATPTLDRMNAEALAHMSDGEEAPEGDDAPADLLAAVPPEEEDAGEGKPKAG